MNMNRRRNIYCFLACLGICTLLFLIRQALIYPAEIVTVSQGILAAFVGFMEAFNLTGFLRFLNELPPFIVISSVSLCVMIIGFGVLLIFSRPVRFSLKVSKNNMGEVIKKGLVLYFAQFALVCVFAYSVIGIPVALLILLFSGAVNMYGMVPFAVQIGEAIQEVLKGSDRRMTYNYIIGAIFLLLCMNVFAVGIAFWAFIIPVLSAGTTYHTFEMKFFRKPVDENRFRGGKDLFDKQQIRDIITKGLD